MHSNLRPEGTIVLITGGSRSGKSEFAEKLVKVLGESCAYIATAKILDEEMRARVQRHQERRRGSFWTNYEAPFDAHEVIREVSGADSILFDCLTLYAANLVYGGEDAAAKREKVLGQIDLLVAAAKQSGRNVVFVANEVGSGIIPDNLLAREFSDLAGQVNQVVAAAADKVYLVVSGIAVDLKKIAVNLEKKEVFL
ncbi:MAG: bifunctional adenosylcobinamide kinase/adenosylcobinamide-phosphate guanylyltransferase [Acidaminococcales bacterium]|nr:bifunctional adenosylcobinamide kinase/adenosylcobinamide-phosphate guanylyltransferase [Acidaminococcales bacterium]